MINSRLAVLALAGLAATISWAQSGNRDRKSTRLNSSHLVISYAVFCLKKKNTDLPAAHRPRRPPYRPHRRSSSQCTRPPPLSRPLSATPLRTCTTSQHRSSTHPPTHVL